MFLLTMIATLGRFLMATMAAIAHDPTTGKVISQMSYDEDGRPTSGTETVVEANVKPQTVATGFAQGGTSNPPAGDDGLPKYFDADGKPISYAKHLETVEAENKARQGFGRNGLEERDVEGERRQVADALNPDNEDSDVGDAYVAPFDQSGKLDNSAKKASTTKAAKATGKAAAHTGSH